MNHKEDLIAGRNAVIEALRAKKPIDKIFVLDGCQDGPIRTIVREAKKTDAILKFVDKERLNQLTNEHHQGVVAIDRTCRCFCYGWCNSNCTMLWNDHSMCTCKICCTNDCPKIMRVFNPI